MFELEPSITLRYYAENLSLSGLLAGSLSKRLIDVSNIDRRGSTAWGRKNERSTAGVYGSVGGGLWAERSEKIDDTKIYLGPALVVGIGTHTALGSLTKMRTKFQFVYLMATPPLHEEARTMFMVTVGFGVISRI
ncbi:hypothetical protein JXA02_09625 [candidate division KSB1 bacterium]|nr:hypothetical protein [candidate division KSB1 bacterium]RQW04239.1 MAG: hypothetical protein EH222_11410 [candidate division KSB1 bacterium]